MPSNRFALCLFAVSLLSASVASAAGPAPDPMPNHGGLQPQYRQTLKAQRAACQLAAAQPNGPSMTLKQVLSQCRKN